MLDVSAVAGRTTQAGAWDSYAYTWSGTTERAIARAGGGLAFRYENGNGFGVHLRADAAYGHDDPARQYLPDGTRVIDGGGEYPLFAFSLGVRGRGESHQTDLGLHRLQSDRGEATHVPWICGRPTDGAGLGFAYCVGPDDPMLFINVLGAGVGAHLGALQVRVLATVQGQFIGDPGAHEVPIGTSFEGWGGWLDLRYEAEPFGVVFSALASARPAARLGLTWAWVLDPTPKAWGGDVSEKGKPRD